jgi:hypothetical protein
MNCHGEHLVSFLSAMKKPGPCGPDLGGHGVDSIPGKLLFLLLCFLLLVLIAALASRLAGKLIGA